MLLWKGSGMLKKIYDLCDIPGDMDEKIVYIYEMLMKEGYLVFHYEIIGQKIEFWILEDKQ